MKRTLRKRPNDEVILAMLDQYRAGATLRQLGKEHGRHSQVIWQFLEVARDIEAKAQLDRVVAS